MKKLMMLVLCLPLIGVAQNSSNKGFEIKGTIDGLADKSIVTLNDLNKPEDTVAKAEVLNGSFVLKGNIAEPNLYQLNFNSVQKKGIVFFE